MYDLLKHDTTIVNDILDYFTSNQEFIYNLYKEAIRNEVGDNSFNLLAWEAILQHYGIKIDDRNRKSDIKKTKLKDAKLKLNFPNLKQDQNWLLSIEYKMFSAEDALGFDEIQ